MKRISLQLMACALAAVVATVAGWCLLLYANHGSIRFRCGLLPTANDSYLHWSGQTGGHLGDGTHVWWDTYGVNVNRVYLTLHVTHVDPKRTAEEAGD
jgi:hypothetical protein